MLERSPAGESTKATRLAAQAFPDLERFTWVGPVAGTRQTSSFGPRWGRLHAGLDFAGPVGTRLKSLSSGVVTFAGKQGGYGNKVEIMLWDGSLVAYGHMDSIAVKQGQEVGPGHVVGRLGNTGHSTGPHLHLEVRPGGGDPIDPWPWLVQRGILPRDVPRS
nr:M23 family metallopeptidase [Kineosphaera limosa]